MRPKVHASKCPSPIYYQNGQGVETLQTPSSFVISGRTDLRIGVSEAKFDVEDDFDVKNSLAPPKSTENHEKSKKKLQKKNRKKNFFVNFFFDSELFETRFGNVLQVKYWKKTAKKHKYFEKIFRTHLLNNAVIRTNPLRSCVKPASTSEIGTKCTLFCSAS